MNTATVNKMDFPLPSCGSGFSPTYEPVWFIFRGLLTATLNVRTALNLNLRVLWSATRVTRSVKLPVTETEQLWNVGVMENGSQRSAIAKVSDESWGGACISLSLSIPFSLSLSGRIVLLLSEQRFFLQKSVVHLLLHQTIAPSSVQMASNSNQHARWSVGQDLKSTIQKRITMRELDWNAKLTENGVGISPLARVSSVRGVPPQMWWLIIYHNFPTEVRCSGDTLQLEGGTVSCSEENLFQSKCRYMCDAGYQMVQGQSETTTCTPHQTWSSPPPTCQKNRCPANDPSFMEVGTIEDECFVIKTMRSHHELSFTQFTPKCRAKNSSCQSDG